MSAEGVLTSIGGRYTAAFYTFGTADTPFLPIDPVAGIETMKFVVGGELKDQGGVGFKVQDGVVFSTTSCVLPSADRFHPPGRFDVAVRCFLLFPCLADTQNVRRCAMASK